LNLHHEIQQSNYITLGDLEQHLKRAGTGLWNNLSKNNNLPLGYRFIVSENYNLSREKIVLK